MQKTSLFRRKLNELSGKVSFDSEFALAFEIQPLKLRFLVFLNADFSKYAQAEWVKNESAFPNPQLPYSFPLNRILILHITHSFDLLKFSLVTGISPVHKLWSLFFSVRFYMLPYLVSYFRKRDCSLVYV